MAEEQTFVGVGGGLAGAKAVEASRERGIAGRLVLFGAEGHLPYERPPLSKSYLKTGEGLDEATVHSKDWYAEHQVDLRLGSEVVEVDRIAHDVVTATGERVG